MHFDTLRVMLLQETLALRMLTLKHHLLKLFVKQGLDFCWNPE